ncbi:CotH kinase family protein [Priestia taiwanensis]|uniref:Spore coat protein H n=1 Tax=Priestia taiwanensis TaxID=1347902 RepID=A0A917EQQ9_9BACI|nr:CotH kinase family protein [Priestia taiwanensis]MBM7363042.1 spore coat protein H [Priestia taiwanensis]GGE67137.1 spore coat protein H [Priestia taiwanensis]
MFQKLSVSSYDFFIHSVHHSEFAKGLWHDNPTPAILSYRRKQYPVSMSYRGAYTRKMKKRSYSVFLEDKSPLENVHTIHLNAEYNDPSLMRNKLALDFFSILGILSPSSTYANITINQKPKGLYLQLESVDENFLRNRRLAKGPIYYAINHRADFSLHPDKNLLLDGYIRKHGTEEDDKHVIDFLSTINTTTKQEFERQIYSVLHVEHYLRWLVGIVCTQNADGFTHNYALYRDNDSKLFSLIPWDYDGTWGRKYNGNPLPHDYISICGRNILTERLLQVPLIRKRYYKLLEATLKERFTPSFIRSEIDRISSVVQPHLHRDPRLKYETHSFHEEIDHILAFIEKRNTFLTSELSVLQ